MTHDLRWVRSVEGPSALVVSLCLRCCAMTQPTQHTCSPGPALDDLSSWLEPYENLFALMAEL